MQEIVNIRLAMAKKFAENCKNINIEVNKSLCRDFMEPSLVKSEFLDIIFRGNNKLNFTTRL